MSRRTIRRWTFWPHAALCLFTLAASGVRPAQAQTETGAAVDPVFQIAPRGYVQFDARSYPDWTVVPGTGRLNHDTVEVRRARFGVDGRAWRVSYEVTLDPQDDDGVFVKDAYGQVRINRMFLVRAGQFKLPGTIEYQTSARSIVFMERSALAESLAGGRDIGAMLMTDLGSRVEIRAGMFAGDGHGRGARAKETVAGRVRWNPPGDLDFGGSFSIGRTSSIDTDPANGLDGRAPSGYRFFERLYVQGQRSRVGVDGEWTPGPWRVAAQVLRTVDERKEQGLDFEDLPAVAGVGWSVEAGRRFGQGAAASRLRDWTLAVRYDEITFDDVGPETGRDSVRPRATDVRARGARTLTASASWRPSAWATVIGNASLEHYSESRSAPEAGRAGGYWVFGTRLQVALP